MLGLILAIVAAMLSIVATLAAQDGHAAYAAAQARPAERAALTAALRHAKRVNLEVPADCTQSCAVYNICLTYSSSNCLGFYPDTLSTVYLLPMTSKEAVIAWKTIDNSEGDQTDEAEGTDQPDSTEGKGLCLAANDTSSSGGAQVYMTTNCGGNPFASWECVQNGDGCNYYNVNSLDYGREYMLTALNTRYGAFIYVEPARSGTWQNWYWQSAGTCTINCADGQGALGHAVPGEGAR
jgi:hypothetical protein